MTSKAKITEPEFSRPLAVEKIPAHGMTDVLEAKEGERKRLAERFGLLDLLTLRVELNVQSGRTDGLILVEGKLTADAVQQCVVTLEPLPVHIERDIHTLYAPPDVIAEDEAGPADPNEEDIEPILNGSIDFGELAAQNLGIALDPYPRKPAIAYVEASSSGDGKGGAGPLAQLVNWPKKPKDSR